MLLFHVVLVFLATSISFSLSHCLVFTPSLSPFIQSLISSTIWHNKVTTTRAQPSESERERDAWRNMAVSICYIFPSPPTQKPPVPSVPLWGAGESVPVPAATKPSSASWSPGTGRKGGHLDRDLTREAKMAGLAHEVSCIMVFFLCVRVCLLGIL